MRTWISEPLRDRRVPKSENKAVVRTERQEDVSWEERLDEQRTSAPKRRLVNDPILVVLSLAATILGLVFVFDAGYARSVQQNRGMIPKEFWTQLLFAGFALGAGVLAARIPLETLRRLAKPLWVLTLLALGGLMIPGVGHELNGAVRWYKLGPITIQPAEFAKVTAVLYLAAVFASRKAWPSVVKVPKNWAMRMDSITIPKLKRAMPAVWVLLGFVFIELEPDLGTGAVLALTAFALFWAGGVSRRSLAWCVGLSLLGVVLLVQVQPYRLERITNHSARWAPSNVDGIAYQTVQSELAMASGGLFGVGMGAGRAKHVMPAATTDFISATVAEEFGFVGWLAAAGVLGALSWRLLTRAVRAPTPFGKLVLCGFGVWIGGQTVVNLMMANGTLPAIGIPLPFVSSGGSSLVALGIAIGLCQSALAPGRMKEEASVAADRDGWRNGRPRLSGA